jgi:hypothetical protein
MLDRLYEYFLTKPVRIVEAGKALLWIGFMLLLFGFLGRIATVSADAVLRLARQPAEMKALRDIYPGLPTWWVPESFVGYFIAVVLIIAGIFVAMAGKRLVRLLGD